MKFALLRVIMVCMALHCCLPLLFAQNLTYVQQTIRTLCSDEFAGRGYVKNGDLKAAQFIKEELRQSKLKGFTPDYFQNFGFPVVTFPGKVLIEIDGYGLVPGRDYLVSPGCNSLDGNFDLIWVDSATIDDAAKYKKLEKQSLRTALLVLYKIRTAKLLFPERLEMLKQNQLKARGIIYAGEEKLTWSVAIEYDKFPVLYMLEGAIKSYQTKARIIVESYLKNHTTQNIAAYIEGSQYKDSFVVFTAHYDHLGMMGDAIFPGANDNASGVAMLLDLAAYYAKNKPKYSIAFIFFAGEEAGLLGSYYYNQNPLFPLRKISLLLNLDLMGTGDKGLTAVNATLFPAEFTDLQLVNNEGEYLPVIQSRGKAKNSDHYFFTENGVKAFFFYLMGNYHFYHDIEDRAEVLPLSRYNEAFKLLIDFVNQYQNQKH